MKIIAGAAPREYASGAGAYFLDLLANRSWIRRQVEAHERLSPHSTLVRISFDIDVADVKRRADTHKVAYENYVLLPLMRMAKEPIHDLDIMLGSGESVHVLTRHENSHLSHASFLAALAKHEPDTHVSDDLHQRSYDVFCGDKQSLASESSPDPPGLADVVSLEATRLLTQATQFYDFVVAVPCLRTEEGEKGRDNSSSQLALVKVSYILNLDHGRRPVRQHLHDMFQFFGFTSIRSSVTPVSNAVDCHLKLTVSPDLKVCTAYLNDTSESKELRKAAHSSKLVSVVVKADDGGHPLLTTRSLVAPSRVFPLLLGALFSFLLAVGNWYVESSHSAFSSQVDTGASVSIIVGVPSIIMIFLVRSSEHFIVSRALRFQRGLVVISSLALFVSAWAMSASTDHGNLELLLKIVMIVTATSAGLVALSWIRSVADRPIRAAWVFLRRNTPRVAWAVLRFVITLLIRLIRKVMRVPGILAKGWDTAVSLFDPAPFPPVELSAQATPPKEPPSSA